MVRTSADWTVGPGCIGFIFAIQARFQANCACKVATPCILHDEELNSRVAQELRSRRQVAACRHRFASVCRTGTENGTCGMSTWTGLGQYKDGTWSIRSYVPLVRCLRFVSNYGVLDSRR